ncbi:MAG: methyltransferase domain-containing protein [Candidatus Tectomicrobia bacterium]|uniref:Methyltransferase domain-containing protein n=1 Tax=Tectimicrobiota bacterium TaxID=2528274 RepID=A0A932FXL5_UNCTE|nr:methyltransferase domain-containing protein [Candidatus Tectomicrobia bacterium]
MEVEEIKKIYSSNYSNLYDLVFRKFFYPRQKHAIQSLHLQPGQKILDVGVGTGLSLDLYPSYCNVVGIDLSADMLKKAVQRLKKHRYDHIQLLEMDASHLAFPDNTFDYVIATFVISVVPDPIKVLAEMKRVNKKEGKIVLVNHFLSQNRFVAKIEELISPLCTKIGWRSDLPLDYLVKHGDLSIANKYQVKKIDLWKVILVNNNK